MKRITAISLGAGVQSSAMALMAAHGEITPMPDVAVFADTQAEPAHVYWYLGQLEAWLPFPVLTATAGNLWDDTLAARNGLTRWSAVPFRVRGATGKPSFLLRHCTRDYKIRPIVKAVAEFAGFGPGKRRKGHLEVEQWIGISRDEAARAKPSRESWVRHRFPLLEMGINRDGCEEWLVSNGYGLPSRSACVFCPFRSDEEWRALRDRHPRDWERAVEFDREIRAGKLKGVSEAPFLHRSLRPLEEANIDGSGQMTIDDFINECEGMCGV